MIEHALTHLLECPVLNTLTILISGEDMKELELSSTPLMILHAEKVTCHIILGHDTTSKTVWQFLSSLWVCCEVCGILAPQLGIEPVPFALRA